MWLFTPYGFYSVSCARSSVEDIYSPVDPLTKMIRARSVLHLQNLQARFPKELGEFAIVENVGTDYGSRLIVPAEQWESVALQLAQEIDYGNFKSKCGQSGLTEHGYTDLLHRVWSAHFGFQQSLAPTRRFLFPETPPFSDVDDSPDFLKAPRDTIAPGEPFVLVSRREKAGRPGPTPIAILIGFPSGRGRAVARHAVDAGAIDLIPKSRLMTTRGVWGDEVPEHIPVFDLGYVAELP